MRSTSKSGISANTYRKIGSRRWVDVVVVSSTAGNRLTILGSLVIRPGQAKLVGRHHVTHACVPQPITVLGSDHVAVDRVGLNSGRLLGADLS